MAPVASNAARRRRSTTWTRAGGRVYWRHVASPDGRTDGVSRAIQVEILFPPATARPVSPTARPTVPSPSASVRRSASRRTARRPRPVALSLISSVLFAVTAQRAGAGATIADPKSGEDGRNVGNALLLPLLRTLPRPSHHPPSPPTSYRRLIHTILRLSPE